MNYLRMQYKTDRGKAKRTLIYERHENKPVQPEHIKQASLFSSEHINFASSSSLSFCLCNAAAYSGSTPSWGADDEPEAMDGSEDDATVAEVAGALSRLGVDG